MRLAILLSQTKEVDISEKYNSKIYDAVRLKFFAHEENDDAITLNEKNIESDYVAHILSLSLPITAFAKDLGSRLEYLLMYENQIVASEISLSLPYEKYPLSVGDAVSYEGKSYLITKASIDNIVITVTLQPIAENLSPDNKDYNFEKSTKFITPSETIIHSIEIDTERYIALENYDPKPMTIQRALQDEIDNSTSFYQDWITTAKKVVVGITETDFYNRPTNILDIDHDIWISFFKWTSFRKCKRT